MDVKFSKDKCILAHRLKEGTSSVLDEIESKAVHKN